MVESREKSSQTEGKALNLEVHPKDEEIGLRAYQLYVERGGADGHDVDDWLQAEQDLLEKYPSTTPLAKKAVA
jgi:hypothetical protein